MVRTCEQPPAWNRVTGSIPSPDGPPPRCGSALHRLAACGHSRGDAAWGACPLSVSQPQSQPRSESGAGVRVCKLGTQSSEFLGCFVPSWAPCPDWHVDSPLRCHIPVAGRALLAVAGADGLIGLYQLLRSKVSGWGWASSGWRGPYGEGFGGTSPCGGLCAGKSPGQPRPVVKCRVLPRRWAGSGLSL